MNFAALITRSEGKTLDFKRDLSSRRNVLRTVVAFANTAGGTVVFGIEDSRAVVGVEDPLTFEEKLANIVSDGVTPRLVPDIDVVAWRGLQVVVVTVYPGAGRPYHLTSEGPEAGAYVRVGSTNRHADEALRSELARNARGESFDEQLLLDLDASSIDFDAVVGAFAAERLLAQREFETLRLITRREGRIFPTVGGVLLFGRDRLASFPDAWLQAGRFRGTDKSHIVDSSDIVTTLPATADLAVAFVRRNMALESLIDGVRRVDHWQFPLVAVREAIINAIIHADYSQIGAPLRIAIYDDRLEVENPGLLLPGLTLDDVRGGVSRLRNRVIGRVFRELGLVEQWGSGIQRMTSACRDAGLADPLLEEIGGRFRVTLFSQQIRSARLDATNEAIVEALAIESGGLSTAQVAVSIGRSSRTARTRLKQLAEEGIVIEFGTGPNDPQRRYLLAEERARYGR